MAIEKKIFAGGGMDMDTNERFMAKTDYKKAVNCRVTKSDEGNDGIVENTRSNFLHSNANIQAGDTVIGAYEDKSTQSVIYFVHAADGNHGIYRRPAKANIEIIIQDPILNFDVNHLITGINVVGSDEDIFPEGLLYWTDDFNPPRKINIHKGITGAYLTMTEQILDAIKYPPSHPPISNVFVTDSCQISNQLIEKSWQFKYRWIYDDMEKSSWSPVSKNIVNSSFNAYYNVEGTASYESNCIPIKFLSGHSTVERIQISARNTNGTDDFFLIADIDKKNINEYVTVSAPPSEYNSCDDFKSQLDYTGASNEIELLNSANDNSLLYFLFYNDSSYSTIDTVESNKLYNDIPHLAKAQEVVDGNRMVYGNIESGQDSTPIDVNLNAVIALNPVINDISTKVSLTPRHRVEHIWEDAPGAKMRKMKSRAWVQITIPPPPPGCSTSYHIEIKDFMFGTWCNNWNPDYCLKSSVNLAHARVMSVDYTSSIYAAGQTAQQVVLDMANDLNAQLGTSAYTTASFGVGGHTSSYSWVPATWMNSNGVVQHILEWKCILNNYGTSVKWSPSGVSRNHIYWNDLKDGGLEWNGNGWMDYKTKWASMGEGAGNGEVSRFNQWSGRNPDRAAFQSFSGLMSNIPTGYNHDNTPGGTTDSFYDYNPTTGAFKWCMSSYKLNDDSYWYETKKSFCSTGTNSSLSLCQGSGHEHAFIEYTPTPGSDIDDIFQAYFSGISIPISDAYIMQSICPTSTSASVVAGVFKSGAHHRFGLVYFDRGNRSSSVNISRITNENIANSGVYIPRVTEVTSITPLGYSGEWNINWEIHNQPPDWATHYQWVYSGNTLTDNFIQCVTDGIYDGTTALRFGKETTDTATGFPSIISDGVYSENYLVDITNIKKFQRGDGGHEVMNYTWQDGDILRIVADNSHLPAINTPYEFKILGVVGEREFPRIIHSTEEVTSGTPHSQYDNKDFLVISKEIVLQNILAANSNYLDNTTPIPGFENYTIEIYSPKKKTDSDKTIYHEFGEVGLIGMPGTPSRFHNNIDSLGVSQVTGTQPATGTFLSGDVYLRYRNSHSNKLLTLIESFHFSDKFKSDYWDKGRPNAVLEDFKRSRKHSTCLYSESYIPNTNINGLSSFFPDVSFQEFERDYNSIQKLHSRDNKLIIFQEDKVSQSLVNRNVLYNIDGSGNVATSDSVLSQAVPYLGNYGINKNPESFAAYGSAMYFVDMKRGAVVRLSNDGFTPISEYKMKNFFTDNFEEIVQHKGAGRHRVLGVYDTKFNEYVISSEGVWTYMIIQDKDGNDIVVKDKQIIAPYTIGFCESSNRWNSFYSYIPEMMCIKGTGFVSFNEGNIYRHNISGTYIDAQGELKSYNTYNNFYGVDYDSELWVVSNEAPSNNKVYQSFSQESDDKWGVTFTSPNGQETALLAEDFDTRENIHYSDIMNDINSDGGLIEGDRMRDVTLLAKLKIFSNKLTKVFGVNFNFAPSQRSNK